jgi:Domain of unknown function (DUF397)
MSVLDIPHLTWHKSSLCSGGDCVEIAVSHKSSSVPGTDDYITFLMRNSKEPAGQVLRFTPAEWAGFISYIKETGGL